MTRDDARMVEAAIAAIVKRLRAEHAAELKAVRDRLDAVEKDLAGLVEERAAEGTNVAWLNKGKRV